MLSLARLPWLKHRPKLELLAAPETVGGQDLRGVIRLHVRRAVKVAGLRVALTGHEEAQFGAQKYASRVTYQSESLERQIFSEVTLEPGIHEHRFSIAIPAGFPPTYYGRRCSTRYYLTLRLAIPWWRDVKSSYEIIIGLGQSVLSFPGEPSLFASESGGPDGKRAYVEGSLSGDVLAPGEVLRGAVALMNTDYNRYTKVVVSLVGTEVLRDKRLREVREVRRLSIELDARDPAEGESLSFALRLPTNLAASADAALWSLHWVIEISTRVRLSRAINLRTPVSVVPQEFVSSRERRAPPRVGSARRVALWQSVADDLGLSFQGAQMRVARGSVAIEVSREHRGRLGWALIGHLRFPDLGLAAQIREGELWEGAGRIKLGNRRWDRRHSCRARRSDQGHVFFAHLSDSLQSFHDVRLSDAEATVRVGDSGIRRANLHGFVSAVLALADGIDSVREVLPVPEEFAEYVEDWQQFARELEGELERGNMSLRGSAQGMQVIVDHEWGEDGSLRATRLRLEDLYPIERKAFFRVQAEGDDGIQGSDLTFLNARRRDLIEPVVSGALWLSSEKNSVWLAMAPCYSPSEVRRRLPRALRFALARSGGKGPYR